jgi:RNA polymerase sigma-70 factor (ECF subfamily)
MRGLSSELKLPPLSAWPRAKEEAAAVEVPNLLGYETLRVQAAAQGDRQAAEELLTEILPRVRNLVRYLVRGDNEVDDIAQESLIAIIRGLPGYRGEGSFPAWADRVVVRATFARMQRMRMERERQSEDLDGLAALPCPSPAPDQYAARREMVRLLDRLPDEQRSALVLHNLLGHSVDEVARELGVPLETVRSRLRLGKASLKAHFCREPIAEGA